MCAQGFDDGLAVLMDIFEGKQSLEEGKVRRRGKFRAPPQHVTETFWGSDFTLHFFNGIQSPKIKAILVKSSHLIKRESRIME